jgi:8-oxo-dGTP diphosphatase
VTEPLEVVGAVIVHDGAVYCTQRGSGALAGKWEFPGGKLEVGESPEQALAREIEEELSCQVDVGDRIVTTRHEYDFATVILTTYYCTLRSGRPVLSEHQEGAWLPPDALTSLDWAPADIPAVHQIQRDLL